VFDTATLEVSLISMVPTANGNLLRCFARYIIPSCHR